MSFRHLCISLSTGKGTQGRTRCLRRFMNFERKTVLRARVGVPLIRRTCRAAGPLAQSAINYNRYYPRGPLAKRCPAAALSLRLVKLLQPVSSIFFPLRQSARISRGWALWFNPNMEYFAERWSPKHERHAYFRVETQIGLVEEIVTETILVLSYIRINTASLKNSTIFI